jgi:hypothetical protein
MAQRRQGFDPRPVPVGLWCAERHCDWFMMCAWAVSLSVMPPLPPCLFFVHLPQMLYNRRKFFPRLAVGFRISVFTLRSDIYCCHYYTVVLYPPFVSMTDSCVSAHKEYTWRTTYLASLRTGLPFFMRCFGL